MAHHWGCDVSGMWPKSSRSSPSRSVWPARAWTTRSVPRCVTWVRWSRRCLSTRRSCPSIPHISTWLRTAWNSTRDMWINSARSNRWVCYWCYKKVSIWCSLTVFTKSFFFRSSDMSDDFEQISRHFENIAWHFPLRIDEKFFRWSDNMSNDFEQIIKHLAKSSAMSDGPMAFREHCIED